MLLKAFKELLVPNSVSPKFAHAQKFMNDAKLPCTRKVGQQ